MQADPPQLHFMMLARFIRSSCSSSISTVHIKSKRGFIYVHSFTDRIRISIKYGRGAALLGKERSSAEAAAASAVAAVDADPIDEIFLAVSLFLDRPH